jgi:hypothetical protein
MNLLRASSTVSALSSGPRRLLIVALGTASLAAMLTASVPGTQAHATTARPASLAAASPCKGKSETHIVRKFFRGPEVFPLRCGTTKWGYLHLAPKHGYDPSMIALTLSRGSGPIAGVFTYTTMTCPSHTYLVVENAGALHGTKVRPQGIITAYWKTPSPAAGRAACK